MIGALKLKGKFQVTKEKIEQKVRDFLEEEENAKREQQFLDDLKKNHNPQDRERIITQKPCLEGKGQIITSGKTVHGQNTDFTKIFESGDYILITNANMDEETRQIITIFSPRSMMIDQPFSVDIITSVPFRYRKKPTMQEQQTLEEQIGEKYKGITKKIAKDKTVLEYREKKGMWGYTNKKEKISKDLTREDIVLLRAKKNRDKFCW